MKTKLLTARELAALALLEQIGAFLKTARAHLPATVIVSLTREWDTAKAIAETVDSGGQLTKRADQLVTTIVNEADAHDVDFRVLTPIIDARTKMHASPNTLTEGEFTKRFCRSLDDA